MEVPSCDGCKHLKKTPDGYWVINCNPLMGMEHESCLYKWFGTQIFALRLLIQRLPTVKGVPEEMQKKMEELVDRQLRDMREDDSWRPPPGEDD